MVCRPTVLRWLNCITVTAQVTGGRKYLPQGSVTARGQNVGSPTLDVAPYCSNNEPTACKMETLGSSEMPVAARHTTMRVNGKSTHTYRTEIHNVPCGSDMLKIDSSVTVFLYITNTWNGVLLCTVNLIYRISN